MVKSKNMNTKRLQLISSDSLTKAISVIENGHVQFAFVVNGKQRLIGTVTDGDIRRALLSGASLDTPIGSVMFKGFRSLHSNATEDEAISLMRREAIHQVPVLDEQGRVVRLFLLEDLIKPKVRSNAVVIMAGGEGKRLRPHTLDCPKPMLLINGKPMLQIILEQCVDAGFHDFYLSVNYLKDQIQDYFVNGERWGVRIEYLEESQPLGTAGALSLLPKKLSEPMLVINGDVLTRINFRQLLRFHDEHQASATLCIREHKTQMPYGVVHVNDSDVQAVEEKPILNHYVSAGIYILDPSLLDLVPHNLCFDMPQLLEKAIKQQFKVTAFPVHEYWLDVGHHDSFESAKQSWFEK